MKQKRNFPSVHITKKQEASLKKGHLWVFADEITDEIEIQNGALVDVLGKKGNYLGTGLWSEHSKIRIRLLGNNANETYEDAFFERRVQYAIQYRLDTMQEDFEACRLIHGEADGLPGLTVDKYNDVLVSEVASFGIEQRKDVIYSALKKELENHGITIQGLYERNESELRKKEGLNQYKGWYEPFGKPQSSIVAIHECGIAYNVNVEEGQKTGFFLDQKYNRLSVRKLSKGKRVLDCCTHTGSFALNAALGGASYVLASDISELALETAKANAKLNQLNVEFQQADVFEFLPELKESHAKFDLIVLDPPAFTKSRRTFESAYRGYKNINAMAMRLLPRGGYLVTNSCSHFMPEDKFMDMLLDASHEAGVSLKLVEKRNASPDHPVLLGQDESTYLKFVIVQIV